MTPQEIPLGDLFFFVKMNQPGHARESDGSDLPVHLYRFHLFDSADQIRAFSFCVRFDQEPLGMKLWRVMPHYFVGWDRASHPSREVGYPEREARLTLDGRELGFFAEYIDAAEMKARLKCRDVIMLAARCKIPRVDSLPAHSLSRVVEIAWNSPIPILIALRLCDRHDSVNGWSTACPLKRARNWRVRLHCHVLPLSKASRSSEEQG
ncbi:MULTISPECIES: hypothetical protein [Caballeronia]|uniref:hypothetical protein n=1 Tax=Caballeronia TaxID=1827195 RepID=UPI001FD368FF|nr:MULTISPECIES: hypothetical protein [Caballeronia]MDR5799076.1 hypothetical protein [Caballeronia sp. LZ001]